ncbi:MAG: thiolase domain-containing protein [Anaerolineaceae bacterium]|nr:thiolase domain-containing protein [Anaerolineaceae bacterium]
MGDVIIAGVGQVPVGEHWDFSLSNLSAQAIKAARQDAGGLKPQSVYIGNFLAFSASDQANLGSLVVENSGLDGIEGVTVEAAEASGAGAFRMAYMAVASGFVETALVVGVEKYTDKSKAEMDAIIAQSMDADYEAAQGLTTAAQAALLMQRYCYEYQVPKGGFSAFAEIAHANGAANPNAMFRKAISRELYKRSMMICEPLNMFDKAPEADGAAAVLLTQAEYFKGKDHSVVSVTGSAIATDTLAIHDRPEPLAFESAGVSVQRACRQAGILPSDVDFFELSDTYSIYAALALEAAGFSPRGQSWQMALDGHFSSGGELPILTMGGHKARGFPLGASGVYQIVEAVLQLRGQAGENQIKKARRALVQSLGGPASTAITHVLEV